MPVEVEIIQDCYDQYNKKVRAKTGRKGWIDTDASDKVGKPSYIRVNLDGNKIWSELPAWKMKLTGKVTADVKF